MNINKIVILVMPEKFDDMFMLQPLHKFQFILKLGHIFGVGHHAYFLYSKYFSSFTVHCLVNLSE